MRRVYARSHSAQMIYLKAIRDWPFPKLIREPMRPYNLLLEAEPAVIMIVSARRSLGARPVPTATLQREDLALEALNGDLFTYARSRSHDFVITS